MTTILVARAASQEQLAVVGRQAGGRVFLFLETDDFLRDYERFTNAGGGRLQDERRRKYSICTQRRMHIVKGMLGDPVYVYMVHVTTELRDPFHLNLLRLSGLYI